MYKEYITPKINPKYKLFGMSTMQFDLDSLMALQLMYDPLKKVLEYLLSRDKAVSDSLTNLQERVSANETKLNEHQDKIETTKTSVDSIKELTDKHDDQIAECNL